MNRIGEGSRRILAANDWLQVERGDKIYTLGDCATMEKRRVMGDIWAILKMADKDNSGPLNAKEFQEVIAEEFQKHNAKSGAKEGVTAAE